MMIHRKIYLIGYMGCGKTTVGKKLSRLTGLPFQDTDSMIEHDTGLTIPAIFAQEGEQRFREMEADILKRIVALESGVVSTGGGFPCHAGRMEQINENGLTVYLRCSPKFLFSRLQQSANTRPLLAGLGPEAMLEKITNDVALREEYYMRAKVVFEADIKQADDLLAALEALPQ